MDNLKDSANGILGKGVGHIITVGEWLLRESYKGYKVVVIDLEVEFEGMEEAIEQGKLTAKERGKSLLEVGKLNVFKPSLDADTAIEHISENAWDECGENGEDYLSYLPIEEIDRLKP